MTDSSAPGTAIPTRAGTNQQHHHLPSFSFFFFLLRLLFVLSALPYPTIQAASSSRRPHIVIIMADDLGYRDLGYQDPEMYTPNLDRMKRTGVTLTNSYVSYACTPSRASFLTGMYNFHTGLQTQTMVFGARSNNTLPLKYRILPEHLKSLGYQNHYVGKWHLGFCDPRTIPTGRGFDTFYGLYNGAADYSHHMSKGKYDLHDDTKDNLTIDWSANGTYSTFLFTNRTVKILENHDQSKPLFLFLSYQAVHGPLEVPPEYITWYCGSLQDQEGRQKICGMTAAMDEGIGIVMNKLSGLGYTDNLITMFISDNGGPVNSGSSNWPFRGGKKTLWEGGTRVPTILHSDKYLPDAPYEWHGLMHAIDWYPTLVRAAGDKEKITTIDGRDNWQRIVKNGKSVRTDFIYNIDKGERNSSAVRWRNWKLINNKPGSPDSWYNPPRDKNNSQVPPRKYPEFMLFDLETDPGEREDLISAWKDAPTRQEGKQIWRRIRRALNVTMELLSLYKEEVVPPMFTVKMDPFADSLAWETGWCNVALD